MKTCRPMIAFAASLLAAPAVPMAADNSGALTTGHISVTGSGESGAPPDILQFTVGVTTEAPTSARALAQNSATMTSVLDVLKKRSIAPKDIRTTHVGLNPQYTYQPNSAPKVKGFQASNQVRVTLRDLNAAGALLDDIVSAGGANQIQSLQFAVEHPDKALDLARAAAIADARHKADTYARASGLTLGGITAIQEQIGEPAPRPVALGVRTMEASSAVPVEPGEQQFRVTVQVDFAAK